MTQTPRSYEEVVALLQQLSAETTIMIELLAEDKELIFLAKNNAPYQDLLDHTEANY
jgi:hypothetical protein